ncbi:prepilin-type N-terminal cleavage/methylation domain-containing protein [Planococcus plakortidis]|uniref:prepilin-type N-terminal cleavage/methylation domain-containing protein n=1 Tax=Planococcus plakortidis TaxID=1038856 RepID=UPI0039847A54
MKKFLQKKLKDQKGMTLIELLAVIVIIAIIAAIAIPAIGNIIDNSRVGAIKSDAQNAIQGAELLLIDNPDALAAATDTITLDELVSEYLDDEASFENDTTFEITRNATSGQLELTGVGTIGSVEVTFSDADKGMINGLANNADVGTAAANSAVVTAR